VTPPEWASTIQAALNAGAGGLAPLAASLLGGAIYDALGPASVFVACAGALGMAMLIMIGAIATACWVPLGSCTGKADPTNANRVQNTTPRKVPRPGLAFSGPFSGIAILGSTGITRVAATSATALRATTPAM